MAFCPIQSNEQRPMHERGGLDPNDMRSILCIFLSWQTDLTNDSRSGLGVVSNTTAVRRVGRLPAVH